MELNVTQCDLAALTRDQAGAVRVSAPERDIRLHILAEGPVWVVADADRIGQVITNYLTNALKYSPDDQAVDVWVTAEGDWARVAVEDRGLGIAPDDLEHIWQPFYRIAGVAMQRGASSGLGMGLYISKTIVELHGGQVGVESVVRRGSTFWFALPMAEQTT